MKGLTSWPCFGEAVLEYFAVNPQYNLIFAPHLKLFERGVPQSVRDYSRYANIMIDCESDKLVDCTYTKQADVYLGDVSSQVYEFLYYNKAPVIYLNADAPINWKDDPNYEMWHLGCVVESLGELDASLKAQLASPNALSSEQALAVSKKFFASAKQPSDLGAQAIKRLLSTG